MYLYIKTSFFTDNGAYCFLDYTDGQVTEQDTAEDMGKNNPNPKTQYYSMKSNDVTARCTVSRKFWQVPIFFPLFF